MAKMKTPKKKEVVKYFENAKEVESHLGQVFKLTHKITKDGNCFRCGCFIIWAPIEGYAKILSYKEPKEKTFKITREQIKEVYGYCNSTELQNTVKEWFPEVFETKLTVGKWYKNKDHLAFITCIDKHFYFNRCFYYGFYLGEHKQSFSFDIMHDGINDFKEATTQEVKEAIKSECIKRKLTPENIAFIDCLCGFNKEDSQEFYKNNSEIKFYFEPYVNKLWIQGASFLDVCVFDNGVFASIIPTLTIQEAEAKLKELGVNAKIV